MNSSEIIVNWTPLLRKHFAFYGATDNTQCIVVRYPSIVENGFMMIVDPSNRNNRLKVNFDRVVAVLEGENIGSIACGFCSAVNTIYMYPPAELSDADRGGAS